jgi:Complex 1 protein (LYR family)
MGSAASMHAARAAAWEEGITHAQRVTRLYRASLRNSRDWVIDYDLWLIDAGKIQARFRANKDKSLAEGRVLRPKIHGGVLKVSTERPSASRGKS